MKKRGNNKKNEDRLKEYQLKQSPQGLKPPLKEELKNVTSLTSNEKESKKKYDRPGRPRRTNRPTRSAAARTLPGEERYRVTLKTEDIITMKSIARKKGVDIKVVFQEAVKDCIKKFAEAN